MNLVRPLTQLTITGELTTFEDRGRGGNAVYVHRRFCGQCGSPILSELVEPAGIVALKAGTLNDRSSVQPGVQVWCLDEQPWVDLDGIPALDREPRSADRSADRSGVRSPSVASLGIWSVGFETRPWGTVVGDEDDPAGIDRGDRVVPAIGQLGPIERDAIVGRRSSTADDAEDLAHPGVTLGAGVGDPFRVGEPLVFEPVECSALRSESIELVPGCLEIGERGDGVSKATKGTATLEGTLEPFPDARIADPLGEVDAVEIGGA